MIASSAIPRALRYVSRHRRFIMILLFLGSALTAPGQAVKLLRKPLDPFGYPRPEPGAANVPVRTSFFLELGLDKPKTGDALATPTLAITLQAAGAKAQPVLRPGSGFAAGFRGWIRPAPQMSGGRNVAVYFERTRPLDPLTTYTVQVTARSREGAALTPRDGRWRFVTAGPTRRRSIDLALDLALRPVHWQGGFFTGFCKPVFCNSATGLEPSYALMAQARRQYPKAWTLQRDFWLTGTDHSIESGSWFHILPNVVRELETRRISAMTTDTQGVTLALEDFFGHGQYGIPANRPLAGDYKPGAEVLIADGIRYARARVLAVDDAAHTVRVTPFTPSSAQFKIDDPTKYPKKSDPKAPGLFPMGGCYLRRFDPAGTPRYYWGRVDREWDIAHRTGHRLMPNFADAPGDLSATGKAWSPPKDFAQLHEVTRAITGHLIERYGKASLDFVWCIFNEPDLAVLFWHGTREELLKFYDYTADGVLRAFEDHGFDSTKVFIGGLEVGWSPEWGGVTDLLRHCSPNEPTTLSLNTAFADPRLAGKRSRRVEALCRAHGGKGAPLDFLSVHAYNRSAKMAAKLIRAKEKALAVDPAYYARLWINSHESAPDWNPPPDEAAADCFLGDGYFPAWCADVAWRQLAKAAQDPRYALGETILTFFPWPSGRFGATNAATTTFKVDRTGDGKADGEATLPLPIFGLLNRLSSMGEDYWVLPERLAEGRGVAGFATRAAGECRILLYAHDPADVQGRGDGETRVKLKLAGLPWARVRIEQTRFDRDHNSALKLTRPIFARPEPQVVSAAEVRRLEKALTVRVTKRETVRRPAGEPLEITANVAANGVNFLVIRPES